jgi:hypothetical protein
VSGRVSALLELGSGFNPEFTGRDNVYLNGAILGLSSKQIDSCETITPQMQLTVNRDVETLRRPARLNFLYYWESNPFIVQPQL